MKTSPGAVALNHSSDCTCRAHPLPASMRVRDARDQYLAENGFSTDGYTSPYSQGSLFGLKFKVPNPASHQQALRLHDLAHVATGFGTDHAGEAEVSVWLQTPACYSDSQKQHSEGCLSSTGIAVG